jgi:uncharacterized protein YjbI with pentapeptide repeats
LLSAAAGSVVDVDLMANEVSWPVAVFGRGVSCATVLWRTHGQLRVTVVIKAMFALVDKQPMRQVPPDAIVATEEHHEGDPARSVHAPSDLAPYVPRADVLFSGCAYAPETHSVPTSAVRIAIGTERPLLEKTIHVFGQRVAPEGDAPPGAPLLFDRMPIVYERAYRGSGFDENPAGIVPVAGSLLPNIIDPSDPEGPAGFGPIAADWPLRARLLRQIDPVSIRTRIAEIPDVFAWSYFQAAPPDQRCDFLRGDEWIVLDGLHPTLARMQSRLPRVRGAARVYGLPGFPWLTVELVADTLQIDGEREVCSVTWRGNFPVETEEHLASLRILTGVEMPGRPIPWPDAEGPMSRTGIRPFTPPAGALTEESTVAGSLEEHIEASRNADGNAEATAIAPSPMLAALAAKSANSWEFDEEQTLAFRRDWLEAPPEQVFDVEDPPTVTHDPDSLADLVAASKDEIDAKAELAGIEAQALGTASERSGDPTPPTQPSQGQTDPAVRQTVERKLAAGEPLDGMALSGADLSGLVFDGCSLAGANLTRATLRRCRFAGADLSGADLGSADLTDAVLDGANLEKADLFGAVVMGASFAKAKLTDTNFSTARGDGARFEGATGERTLFSRGRWSLARFDEAHLSSADFTEAVLLGAVFDWAEVPEIRLYEARAPEVSFNHATMAEARADGANMRRASFERVFAPDSVWEQAALDEASFRGAILTGASFVKASCRRAVFSDGDLSEARFKRAKLEGAQFVKTDVSMATFEGADLKLADLSGANVQAASVIPGPPNPEE